MFKANRIRWGDHDRYFGPFTYSRSLHYSPIAICLDSGDGDDYPGCRIRTSAFGHTLILAVPAIIKPFKIWKEITHEPSRSQIINQGREPGYWDIYRREFGFSCSEGFLQIFFGAQTHDSSTTQSWSKFLPWRNWRHVRRSLYDLEGNHFWTYPKSSRPKLGGKAYHNRWAVEKAVEDACPTVSFEFDDYDGERIIATTKIEEREWRFGEGWFKWLSLFRKPKIRRSLDMEFSKETGTRKGSWKGGTIGAGIDMSNGELHESAFKRYCAENNMTFVAKAKLNV